MFEERMCKMTAYLGLQDLSYNRLLRLSEQPQLLVRFHSPRMNKTTTHYFQTQSKSQCCSMSGWFCEKW